MLRWICLISMTACASLPRPTSVPLTIRASRAVTMPVVVDGTPLVFQLDTGASNSVITPATRDRLHLAHGKTVAASGAGGAVDSAEAVVLHDMRVGDRRISDLEVAVVDVGGATGEQSIDGIELHLADQPALILGIDRLGDARIVIDPHAKLVYISRRNPAGSPSVSPPSP